MAVSISAVFIAILSIQKIGDNKNIWIEAEDAIQIFEPLQIIEMEGASNNKGVISIGAHLKNEGFAKYNITITDQGQYYIWCRCFWQNVCSNAFKLAVDDSRVELIGENPVINRWHWVLGSSFELNKGNHELILWNHEEGSKIDKLLITSDPYFIPSDLGLSNDIYIDFAQSTIPKYLIFGDHDNWKIVNDSVNNYKMLTYAGQAEKSDVALLKISNPDFYIFRIAYKLTEFTDPEAKIFLTYKNDSNYTCISFVDSSLIFNEVCEGKIHYYKKLGKYNSKLSDFAIKKEGSFIKIKHNGNKILEYNTIVNEGSYVGFQSKTNHVMFGNINIISKEILNYSENFHTTNYTAFAIRPEISPDFFQQLKKGRGNWWQFEGIWKTKYDGFEALEGIPTKQNATIIFGDDFMQSYNLLFAGKLNGTGSMGVLFNYQDSNNFYKLTLPSEDIKEKSKLSKFINNKELILSEKDLNLIKPGKAFWYKFYISSNKGLLSVFIDDQLIYETFDSTFTEGKLGFWTNSKDGAEFDDIFIFPFTKDPVENTHEYYYGLFANNNLISLDYADWILSADGIIKYVPLVQGSRYEYCCLHKEVFQTPMLKHKKILNGDINVIISTSKIPRDINISLLIENVKGNKKMNREFVISNERIAFFANNNIVDSYSVLPSERDNIILAKENNQWKIKICDNKEVIFSDEQLIQNLRFSFGYSGIGEGKIFLNTVFIKE